jgi:hypothetical protein
MQRLINIPKINCAPSWFLFTRLYRDPRSTKHKILKTCLKVKKNVTMVADPSSV